MVLKQTPKWISLLDDEDLMFLKRFVLLSGSLKELAQAYEVSYPTIRLRLDRLIEKIRTAESSETDDSFERLLRAHYAEGKIDSPTFRRLLESYREQKREEKR